MAYGDVLHSLGSARFQRRYHDEIKGDEQKCLDLEQSSRRRRLEINYRAEHLMQIRFEPCLGRSLYDSEKVPRSKQSAGYITLKHCAQHGYDGPWQLAFRSSIVGGSQS